MGPPGPQLLARGPSGLLTCPSRPSGAQAKEHTHRTLTIYDALTMDDAMLFGDGRTNGRTDGQGVSRSRIYSQYIYTIYTIYSHNIRKYIKDQGKQLLQRLYYLCSINIISINIVKNILIYLTFLIFNPITTCHFLFVQ